MPHTAHGMSHCTLGTSKGCQESCRAGRVPALGTVSCRGSHGFLSAPRTCQVPSSTFLSAPSWVPGPADTPAQPKGKAAPFQPLHSSHRASTWCPFGTCGTSSMTLHSKHNQLPPPTLPALPLLLSLANEPRSNYCLLADTPRRE